MPPQPDGTGAPKLSKSQVAYLASIGKLDAIPDDMLPTPDLPTDVIDAIEQGKPQITHQGKTYRRRKVTYVADDASSVIVGQWHNGKTLTATLRQQYDATLPDDFSSWQALVEATCNITKQGKVYVITPKPPFKRRGDKPYKTRNPLSSHNCRQLAGRWDLARRYQATTKATKRK